MIVKSKRGRLSILAVTAVIVVAAIFGSGFGRAAENTSCAPPRGPGDNLVHSSGLRVANLSCSVGRAVALACIRFTEGHAGVCAAAGYRWRCTSTKANAGPESVQRCVSGSRSMRILWLD